MSANGYLLSPIAAPGRVGEAGTLSFRILDDEGTPVTAYATTHERNLHLIVVRTDGQDFRHVHPELNQVTGTWSMPWSWTEAGTFRVYADFAPAAGSPITLSRTVEVAGEFAPIAPEPTRVSQVDGYMVTLAGDLKAGSPSELTLTVTRDGAPVTTLQPYLGAFGHLVALRQGDLAFLHVHPEGTEPTAGEQGGPAIRFAAQTPTAGRYLLYLDFQIEGTVRTATFVVDAGEVAGAPASQNDQHGGSSESEDSGGHGHD